MANENGSNWTTWVASTAAFGATAHFVAQKSGGFQGLLEQSRTGGISPTISTSQHLGQRTLQHVVQRLGGTTEQTITALRAEAAGRRLSRLEGLLPHGPLPSAMSEMLSREWEVAKSAVLRDPLEMGSWDISAKDPLGGIRLALEESGSVHRFDVLGRFSTNVEALMGYAPESAYWRAGEAHLSPLTKMAEQSGFRFHATPGFSAATKTRDLVGTAVP